MTAATTDAVREAWAGRRIGLAPDLAARVADLLAAEGRLGDGVVGVVVLHASRRGMDAVAAAHELVAGERGLPRAPSDYELRTTRDEARDLWRDDPDDPSPAADPSRQVRVGALHVGTPGA